MKIEDGGSRIETSRSRGDAARPPLLSSIRHLRSATAWVTLLLLGVYLLCTGGQPFISDGEVMLIATTRLIDAHTLTLPEAAASYPQVVRRQDGFVFAKYGLGQSLAAAPLYYFGRYVLAWLLPNRGDFLIGRFCALLLPAVATALAAGMLCDWAGRLYGSTRTGVALALLFGIGTLAWPYSRFFFSEPLFSACVLAAAYAIFSGRPMLAGLAFGYAVLTRTVGVTLLPALLVYLALRTVRDQGIGDRGQGIGKDEEPRTTNHEPRRWSVVLRRCVWFGLGMLPCVLLLLAYNELRFRTFAEQGYANEGFTGSLREGLYGLLFSSGKSLFLYVPLFFALPFAAWPFARRFSAEALLVALVTATMLATSATWWIWWGGHGWGPRFLVPLMPLLVLPLGALFRWRAWRWIIGAALLPLSLAVNALGVLVDFNGYINAVAGDDLLKATIYLFQPAYSPIVGHAERLDWRNVPIVSWRLDDPSIGFAHGAALALFFGMVLLTCAAACGLMLAVRRPGTRRESPAPVPLVR